MPWDLERRPPKRFYFDKDQLEWVDLRLVDDDEKQEIRERLGIKLNEMVYVPNPAKDNQLELVPGKIDGEQIAAFMRELNFAGIPAWNLVAKGGTEIPHTIENVDLMIRKSRRFAAFVKRGWEQLVKDELAEAEEERKN